MLSLSRTASSLARRSARFMSSEAAAAPTKMTLNFCLPHETIYHGAQVSQVIIPGIDGEYGVTVNHVPTVAQLKPGVLQILHEEGEAEKYFVAGGFALTHANSVTDITCPEAVKLDDLDSVAIQKNYEAARIAFGSAESGSLAQAEAEIEMETTKAMAIAIGVAV